MESRGQSKRPAIARHSCDQCRVRKIGCDRGSPCSNCISARLNCAHSAVTSNASTPKQRILISAQYEQKIDDIAKGIDGIKVLLQERKVLPDRLRPKGGHVSHLNQAEVVDSLTEQQPTTASGGEPLWDHPAHIIDFVKTVVQDRGSRDHGAEAKEVFSSLENLVQTLENRSTVQNLSFPEAKIIAHQADASMPPLEAVVAVLRWAKDHKEYNRIAWISRILPLQKWAEICQRVYFAIEDYSEMDLILANGYLSYIFSEHVVISGLQDYREYGQICRRSLHIALSRLPLLLPASMETIATLTIGALNAIEHSKAIMAWRFILSASDLCQTLGYHRQCSPRDSDRPLRDAQQSLFWFVYKIEKGFSLRLGRSSSIRDSEITLPIDPAEPRPTRLARIQGKVYDQLYSPVGLSRPDHERGTMAEALAEDLRKLITETHVEIFQNATSQPTDNQSDITGVFYLQSDLVCQSSLLALILRAVPTSRGVLSDVSDECAAAARDSLDLHEECMLAVRSYKNDPSMATKYLNWAILHSTFVPFSILFTRAIQLMDTADLARLDRFATSLQPNQASPESITHPYRLYKLLCQAIRLYIDTNLPSSPTDPTLAPNIMDTLGDFDIAHYGVEMGSTGNGTLEAGRSHTYGLSNWFYGNQQFLSLLDEDVMF